MLEFVWGYWSFRRIIGLVFTENAKTNEKDLWSKLHSKRTLSDEGLSVKGVSVGPRPKTTWNHRLFTDRVENPLCGNMFSNMPRQIRWTLRFYLCWL